MTMKLDPITKKFSGTLEKTKDSSQSWKGGKFKRTKSGYVLVRVERDSPLFCMTKPPFYKDWAYAFEHRIIMARYLGRPLTKNEIVHHINGITDDNRIGNLRLTNRHNHFGIDRKEIEELKGQIRILQDRVTQLEAENVILRSN